MRLNRTKANVVFNALETWDNEKLISHDISKKLKESIEITPFDWRRLAKYSFLIAIIAFIIAVGSIFSDNALMKLVEMYFGAPPMIKALTLLGLSVLFFLWGIRRKRDNKKSIYKNEAIFVLGVLSYASSLFYIGETFNIPIDAYNKLILVGCISYGALGFLLQSPLIWIFALLSLGGWMGAETGYMSGWGAYYLGMNYPIRFALFGAVLTGFALLYHHPRFLTLQKTTLVMGLLYLFISLWILSIFGNYTDFVMWHKIKQIELFHWSVLFALVSIAVIALGLKYDNSTTRAFGLVFLFINLYTRFFEYFWDSIHKAIFFAILGLSLWFIGSHAEKIWNLRLGGGKG